MFSISTRAMFPSRLFWISKFLFLFTVFNHCFGYLQNQFTNFCDRSQLTRFNKEDYSSAHNKTACISPEMNPFDLINGTLIPAVYDLHMNQNLKLLFYFNYGSNSFNTKKLVLNPRFYSKYVIIQSK